MPMISFVQTVVDKVFLMCIVNAVECTLVCSLIEWQQFLIRQKYL